MLKRKFLRQFAIYFVVCMVALGVFGTTRILFIYADNVQDENIQVMESFGVVKFLFLLDVFMSAFIALLSSLVEVLLLRRLFRKGMPIALRLIFDVLIRTIVILVVIFGVRNVISSFFLYLGNEVNLKEEEMLPMMLYLGFTITLCSFTVEIDRKLGPGNLWKFLTAKFYKPREEERLFMFIDLKDATTIAEKIGHLNFSRMIRDCFQDFSVVDNYEAEIYQYVGDEVVISWPLRKGLKNHNFIKAFYAFTNKIKNKESYYLSNYNQLPYFKAGVHCGPIVVSEVGDIKREISYHGDTINTASRIQGMCNQLHASLLISEVLYEKMKKTDQWNFTAAAKVQLKGKVNEINLYKVEEL